MLEYDTQKGYNHNTGISSVKSQDTQRFIFVPTGDSLLITTLNSKGNNPIEIDEAIIDNNGNVNRQLSNAIENLSWIPEPVEQFVLFGDLDKDNRVDTFDLILLRQYIINGITASEGDINDDGDVGVADLVKLERFLLGSENFNKTGKGTPRNTIFPKI